MINYDPCWKIGPKSKLKRETLLKYAKSKQLQRTYGLSYYMHRSNCNMDCHCMCNGIHGKSIATDIEYIEEDKK